MIDQLISNNTVGVQNEHIPIEDNQHELENPPPHMSHHQTTFVPPVTSSLEGVFTYPIPCLPSTYPSNIFVNPINHQIPQSHPQINLNISSNLQGPHYPATKPFMLDTTFHMKVETDELSVPIDKNLLKRLDRFDEFMKKS